MSPQAKRAPSPQDEAARAATYPPPYPSGWYKLMDSRSLRRGEVRQVRCLGESLAVFRSDVDGRVAAIDAHCPHLGALLTDGRVVDGCVECPFHLWRLDGDGAVRAVPYAERLPRARRTRSWPILELHGLVLLYHRHGRDASPAPVVPPWSPRADVIAERGMVYRGRHDAGVVRMHLVEFAENSVDFQHFAPLHGRLRVPWTQIPVPGFGIEHRAAWELDDERPHVAYFHDDACLSFRGRRLPATAAQATITFQGPGSLVMFHFRIPRLGQIVLFQTHTPLAPLEQHVQFRWFADPGLPRLLVSYVVGNWVSQWRQDIAIWERKVYQRRPLLVAEDGPVARLRRWFSQFYEEPGGFTEGATGELPAQAPAHEASAHEEAGGAL
jgi:cholesterol 7-dehydrogenase